MSAILEDSPEVKAAYDAYKKFTANPAIRNKIMSMERDQINIRLRIAGARREGIMEGEAKGKAEGEAEGRKETARRMKKEGFDTALISKLTGLSAAQIENLQ